DTVQVCKRLNEEGFNPVPHIVARNFENTRALEIFLDLLVSTAYVCEVLVIAGDISRPLGPFSDSLQILNSGLLEKYQIRKVGVAGHPEGSPDISKDKLANAISDKNNWAKNSDMEAYITTQFCFEVPSIITWEKNIRKDGNKLPIHIGIPGPATLNTLIKFATMSGIGPSIRVLTRQTKNLTKLVFTQDPFNIIEGIAFAKLQDPDCLIEHLHFYPFGGLAKTTAWVKGILEKNEFRNVEVC
ncbi:MAG: metFprotein, partial [Pseudomonadota bacterium]|nr:metFprotein [Pseudomonadota bacterium]